MAVTGWLARLAARWEFQKDQYRLRALGPVRREDFESQFPAFKPGSAAERAARRAAERQRIQQEGTR